MDAVAESVVLARHDGRPWRRVAATGGLATIRLLLVTAGGERVTASLSDDEAVEVAGELLAGISQGEPIELRACPPGAFVFRGALGFKTEYGNADAYVMATGEAFWGGTVNNEARARLMVRPVAVMPL